jgi:phage portal protein BeeE
MLVNLGAAVPQEAVEKETPKGWVTLGEANLFSDYLIDLYYSSPVHSALTMSIAFMIAGKEFKSNNPAAQREIDRLKLNSIRRPITLDAKMQGGYYLEIIWSVDRTTVAKINHLPYENVRLAVANDEDVIPGVYYSKDWNDIRKKKNIPTFIPMYNPTTKSDEPSQVLFVGIMTPGSAYYPKPDYYSAINYIEITREISEFYRAFLSNGMNPSYMLHMNNGIPDPEEQMAIRRNWETMMGAKKAGKVVFTFNESADRAPRLDLVDMTQADKQWMELSTQSRENILAAHRVTSPLLFGIRDAGGLGSNADEMKQAYRIFNKNIIEPYQQIVTDSLEEVFKGMGIMADIYIEANDIFSDEMDAAIAATTPTVADNATTDPNAAAPVAPAGASVSDVTYNGAQIASALEIVAAVQTGALTTEQAIVFLVQFLQLPIDVATAMFQPSQGSAVAKLSAQKKKTNLSDPQEKPPIFTDEDEAWWCEFLEDKGEIVDEEEWELIEAEPVNLASVRSYSDPDKPSEMDSGLYKIRYSYSKNLSGNSRKFCRQMVSASKAGYVYRYEDLTAMERDSNSLNPNMGHNGSTYSVWLFHGGVNCKHYFERRVYFRKREKGRFIADNGLESSDPISVAKAIRAGMPLKDIAKGFAQANTATYDQSSLHGRYPGTN